MSTDSAARSSLVQRLTALLALLRELRTATGRRRIRAGVRSRLRRRRSLVGGRPNRRNSFVKGPLTDREPAAALTGGEPRWRPRALAERLARRAHRASGESTRSGPNSGGVAVRERYGHSFYSSIGARGGSTVLEERGVEYLQDIGARGGAATRRRYGPEHYAEIGRKGGLAGRGRKRPRKRRGQLELPLEG